MTNPTIVAVLGSVAIALFWLLRKLSQVRDLGFDTRRVERPTSIGLIAIAVTCPLAFTAGVTWVVTREQNVILEYYEEHIRPSLENIGHTDITTPSTPGG